jgi:Family of unknown function (DUF6636)
MRRFLATSLIAACMVVALPGVSQAAIHNRYFQMPSHNIFCAIFDGLLRCDIGSGLNPEPSRPCDLDWTGLSLKWDGKARPVCAGDTVRKRGERILRYGHTWRRHRIVCKSRRTGLRCHNYLHHGFRLSREHWATH